MQCLETLSGLLVVTVPGDFDGLLLLQCLDFTLSGLVVAVPGDFEGLLVVGAWRL